MKALTLPIWMLALAGLLFSSCVKKNGFNPDEQFELEKPMIENYVLGNIPGATKHAGTGIWWVILQDSEESDSDYVYKIIGNYLESPIIKVKYTGVLLNGFEFDSEQTGVEFSLGGLIPAWHYMFFPTTIGSQEVGGILPKGLRKGMKVRFVTPSYYAYGQYGKGQVPSNAPLDFTVEILDIKAPETNNPE